MTLNKLIAHYPAVVVLLLLLSTSLALAQSYGFTRSTSDGGGGLLQTADSNYALNGSIGQADASTILSDGGSYMLNGGYWAATGNSPSGGPSNQRVYLPVLLRNP